jgi:ribokinase
LSDQQQVFVIGDVNIDVVFTLQEYPAEGTEALSTSASYRLGGSACNTASALAFLGVEPVLFSNVGRDAFGTFATLEIEKIGVKTDQVHPVPDGKTGFMMITITLGGQRTMFGFRGCNALPYSKALYSDAVRQADWVHLTGYSLLDDAQYASTRELMAYAHSLGKPVSLDPGVEPAQKIPGRIQQVLPFVSVFLVNDLEALQCAQAQTMEDSIRILREKGPAVLAIKQGKSGCRVITTDQDAVIPPFTGEPIVDTNGAGDSFNAGFISGILRGFSPMKSARIGNAVAYLVITSGNGVSTLHSHPRSREMYSQLLSKP